MENEKDSMRLNKYLSGTGLCSRREADKLIEEGHVTVESADGEVKTATLGSRVRENDRVFVDGKPVRDKGEEKLYMVINKPKGVICTGDRRVKENIIDFAGLNHYISYAGRLDRDSTGLVLLTNDGDLNDKIMRASGFHEKEYIVKVDKYITDDFLNKMSRGVSIVLDDDRHLVKGDGENPVGTRVTTRPCVIERRGARKFGIILTQGYNRQIRRMCQALGYTALEIKRIRIMNLRLGGLREGMKRFLTREEIEGLKALADAPGTEPVARVITNANREPMPGARTPNGDRPRQGERPYGGRTHQSERPYGDRPRQEERPYGEKPYRTGKGDKTQHGERPYSDRTRQGEHPYGERPYRDGTGEKSYPGGRPAGDGQRQAGRTYGEKAGQNRFGGERPRSDKGLPDKRPAGDRQRQGERTHGEHFQRNGSPARYGREDAGRTNGRGGSSQKDGSGDRGRRHSGQPYPARREKRNHDRNDA